MRRATGETAAEREQKATAVSAAWEEHRKKPLPPGVQAIERILDSMVPAERHVALAYLKARLRHGG